MQFLVAVFTFLLDNAPSLMDVTMPLELVRVLWKSYPYGWLLRWLDEQGRYTAELMSFSPPYRHRSSGSLNADDAACAWQLVQRALESTATESQSPRVAPHIGFIVPVPHQPENDPVNAYYYYSNVDNRNSTRCYVELILIIDKYLRDEYKNLLVDNSKWESHDDQLE